MNLFEELKYRGMVADKTSDDLVDKLNNEKLTFYIGTDPTANSLHVGHLMFLILAKRLEKRGHNPIILVGGATGLIGDPRPSSERPIVSKEVIESNFNALKSQIEELFGFKVVNNYDWCKDINFIDYLRDYGKYFPVPYMLAKDVVKSRLEIGITYTEFSYMIMQALDFLHLYENENCTLQIGGQDQWGNVTSGVELIRKKIGVQAFGMTYPLMTNSDGSKIGKSEGATIWLDKNKTSSYELYQFFFNASDEKVIDYLKKFTFLTKTEIDELETSLREEPHLRKPHKALAENVVRDIHGQKELDKALNITDVLFEEKYETLTLEELLAAFKGVDSIVLDESKSLVDCLVLSKLASSNREAREFIKNGSVKVNGEKEIDLDKKITTDEMLKGRVCVLKRGKKKYALIKWQ